MDYKLELVLIPVSHVGRARDFYVRQSRFRLEVDGSAGEGARIVQVTPPGSACSVGFGTGLGLAPAMTSPWPRPAHRGVLAR